MGLDIGAAVDEVPLTTLEDHAFTMKNFAAQRGTAILFLSARCEATDNQIDEINSVHSRFRLRDVLFVGICPNAAETPEELRTFAQRRGCTFPIYRDPQGDATKLLAPTATPEAFLIDAKGVLQYRGAVAGLENAITLITKNRPVEAPEVAAEGTPIGADLAPRDIDDQYGTIAFSSEVIFEKAPGAVAHHCSTLCEAANGDLLCLWYGGTYESAEDQVLFLARLPKSDRHWSTPEAVVKNPGQPPGNAVIFRDGLGRIWIVWGRMEAERPIRRGSGWGQCRLLYRISEDHGATWGDDREFEASFGWLPRNVTITRSDDALCLPLSGVVDGTYGSFFLETKDNGQTWKRSGVVPGGSQPTMIERDDGSLLFMMRSRPMILESTSDDLGVTWKPAQKSALRNPDAGIAMTKLDNGHAVIVFNDSSVARTPLSVARSVDSGQRWEKPLDLETNPGEYSYPSVIQASDSLIHVTYTFRRYAIKHVAFSESWLTDFERPN